VPRDDNVFPLHHQLIVDAVAATLEKHHVDAGAPYEIAKLFRHILFTANSVPTIHHHHDSFYAWNGNAYPELGETEIRSQLYKFLNQCVIVNPKGETAPYKPNMSRVANVLDALRGASNLSDSVSAPAWLDCVPDLPAADIIACANGLLFLPTLDLLPCTPLFFTHNALDFGFDRSAPEPVEWKRFLEQLWLGDQEAIDVLQEIFGYFVTADTSHQKGFYRRAAAQWQGYHRADTHPSRRRRQRGLPHPSRHWNEFWIGAAYWKTRRNHFRRAARR